jgi:hypothetical protein
MSDYRDAARRTAEILGESAARDLLRLLESDDVIRADASDSSMSAAGMNRCLTR